MKPLYLFTSPEYVGRPVDMFAAPMTIISFYVMVVTLFYLVIDELVLTRPLAAERLRDKPCRFRNFTERSPEIFLIETS